MSRSTVIRCLPLAPHEEVEPALHQLAESEDRFAVIYVARALGSIQTETALAGLVKFLDHPYDNAKTAALAQLEERVGAGVLPFARRLAGGTRWTQYSVSEHIARYGDADDLPFMALRIKKLLKSKQQYEPPEVGWIVPFLERLGSDPRAAAALRKLREGARGLPDNEREWLEAHPPGLASR